MGQADFKMIDAGNLITNTISDGADGQLFLTFTFEWVFPDIETGSKEAAEKEELLRAQAVEVVPHTIDQIRAMVREGTL